MKKNDKGSKADSVSVATKKGISPDIVQARERGLQKHPHQMPQSLLFKLKDQSAWHRRHKPLSPPSTQNQKKSETASWTNSLGKRIFSTPEPGSLGKGLTN